MPHIIILSIAVGAAAGGGVLLAVDVLLSENIDRQYELTPIKSTTVSLTTTPKLTSGQCLTPMLSIIGQKNAVVVHTVEAGGVCCCQRMNGSRIYLDLTMFDSAK